MFSSIFKGNKDIKKESSITSATILSDQTNQCEGITISKSNIEIIDIQLKYKHIKIQEPVINRYLSDIHPKIEKVLVLLKKKRILCSNLIKILSPQFKKPVESFCKDKILIKDEKDTINDKYNNDTNTTKDEDEYRTFTCIMSIIKEDVETLFFFLKQLREKLKEEKIQILFSKYNNADDRDDSLLLEQTDTIQTASGPNFELSIYINTIIEWGFTHINDLKTSKEHGYYGTRCSDDDEEEDGDYGNDHDNKNDKPDTLLLVDLSDVPLTITLTNEQKILIFDLMMNDLLKDNILSSLISLHPYDQFVKKLFTNNTRNPNSGGVSINNSDGDDECYNREVYRNILLSLGYLVFQSQRNTQSCSSLSLFNNNNNNNTGDTGLIENSQKMENDQWEWFFNIYYCCCCNEETGVLCKYKTSEEEEEKKKENNYIYDYQSYKQCCILL